MEAREKELKFLATEDEVIIPFFQRTYVWEEENWERLLEELSTKPEGHFLGSIILKQLRRSTGGPTKLEVIDGQQRLTTLSILIKALYDTFSQELKENTKNEVRQILFSKQLPSSKDYFVKIRHSRVDREAYEKVIRSNIDDDTPPIKIEDIDKNDSNRIYRCYKYFYETLKEKTEEERRNLFDKILNSSNKMLVVIDLVEEKDDEQAIFDTLNTAGVRLTTAEIIKNALFQRAIQILDNKEEVIKLYEETWEKTFLAEDSVKYWEMERPTGRLKRDNLEILLHSIAIIKDFFDPDKHTLSQLSDLYKKKIREIQNKDDLKTFINEIIEYARIYREKVPDLDKSTLFSFEDSIIRLFHILEVQEISTFHPFILYVFKKYQRDESKIKRLLNNLEKFIIRRAIGQQETKNYNKFCKEFIKDPESILEKLKDTTEKHISDGLRKISNKTATLLLFWVELYRRNKDDKQEIKELKYTYSLEHIMPQQWEEHWSDIPKKYKPDGTEMTEEEKKKDRNEKVYWIGNMTLLKTALNSALKNYSFEKKMIGEGRKKGIKDYAELLITRDDIVLPFEKGNKVWDENSIIKRTENLEKEIKMIW